MTKNIKLLQGDCLELMKQIPDRSIDMILSDIPYGISYDNWDVLHNNSNSALLGTSPAQAKAGSVFRKRGKPLNGWSEADKKISIEYYEWCCAWSVEWLRVLKSGASVFIFAGRRMAHRCIAAMEDAGFTFKDMISWEKESAPHRAQRISIIYERRGDQNNKEEWDGWRVGNLRPVFEPILWFVKPYPIGSTLADNVAKYNVGAFNDVAWNKYANASSNIIKVKSTKEDHGKHPTQKPVELLKALIELTTKEDQIVLDPFMGSGSTGVACVNTNRKFIGMELGENYCQIAKNRIEEEMDKEENDRK